MNLNLSGFLSAFKLVAKPSLCLPHATVSTFGDLPSPLERAFEKKCTIKAVVLDKDDCFAYPDTNQIHPPYAVRAISGLVYPPLHRDFRDLIVPRSDSSSYAKNIPALDS